MLNVREARGRGRHLAHVLLAADVAVVETDAVEVVTNIAYKTGAGLTACEVERCKLDLYLPRGKKDFATLLWFHVGGLQAGSKADPMWSRDKFRSLPLICHSETYQSSAILNY